MGTQKGRLLCLCYVVSWTFHDTMSGAVLYETDCDEFFSLIFVHFIMLRLKGALSNAHFLAF